MENELDYEGQLDENDVPLGTGKVFTEDDGLTYAYVGTWLNGELHGICKFACVTFFKELKLTEFFRIRYLYQWSKFYNCI